MQESDHARLLDVEALPESSRTASVLRQGSPRTWSLASFAGLIALAGCTSMVWWSSTPAESSSLDLIQASAFNPGAMDTWHCDLQEVQAPLQIFPANGAKETGPWNINFLDVPEGAYSVLASLPSMDDGTHRAEKLNACAMNPMDDYIYCHIKVVQKSDGDFLSYIVRVGVVDLEQKTAGLHFVARVRNGGYFAAAFDMEGNWYFGPESVTMVQNLHLMLGRSWSNRLAAKDETKAPHWSVPADCKGADYAYHETGGSVKLAEKRGKMKERQEEHVKSFTKDGTWVADHTGCVEVLVVAGGGGGGGRAGGGGAGGGLIHQPCYEVKEGNAYPIKVGKGGEGGSGKAQSPKGKGLNGEDSSFGYLVAKGGGGGSGDGHNRGREGGNGGGGRYGSVGGQQVQTDEAGHSGQFGYGFDGGKGTSGTWNAGGGGGAGGKGMDGSNSKCGDGGKGQEVCIIGTCVTYGGGGGGGSHDPPCHSKGKGGAGGGGKGGTPGHKSPGEDGEDQKGGGGGGGSTNSHHGGEGGKGGDGVVIIAKKLAKTKHAKEMAKSDAAQKLLLTMKDEKFCAIDVTALPDGEPETTVQDVVGGRKGSFGAGWTFTKPDGTSAFYFSNNAGGVYGVDYATFDLSKDTVQVSEVGKSQVTNANDGVNCMAVKSPFQDYDWVLMGAPSTVCRQWKADHVIHPPFTDETDTVSHECVHGPCHKVPESTPLALTDCQRRCREDPECHGVEYRRSEHRCEVLARPERWFIDNTKVRTVPGPLDFECWLYKPPCELLPKLRDHGANSKSFDLAWSVCFPEEG